MPKNVMKLLKPSPHRARNDFDLSHRHVFDANFGEILPATSIEVVPGDNITLHASDLLRAIPFVSSPFLRAKQHLDVWFVPYHDLWHQFDAFITKKSEPVSAAFKKSNYCPWVSQYDLYRAVNTSSTTLSSGQDVVGRPLADRSYYLLELLGYGNIKDLHGTSSDTFKVNPFRLAAYNYIWYNEYRQQYYDDGSRLLAASTTTNPACLFNFDDLVCDTVSGAQVVFNTTVNRLAAMVQMRYRTWKKDLFTGVMPSTQFGNVSTIPFTGNVPVSVSGTASISGTTGTDYRRHLLVDSSTQQYFALPDLTGEGAADAYGNPLFGGISLNSLSLAQTNHDGKFSHRVYGNNVNNAGTFINPASSVGEGSPDYLNDVHDHTISGSATISSSGTASLSGNAFDVLALRKSEAIQIWRENALRAGNHIKDNMIAHYGVASDFNDHRPTYLGSVSAPLNIGDIATTANSSSGINDTVGDIAGKGLSSLSEKVFKFHAKDFGVIMVMFSMLPEAEYDAQGIDRCNQLLEAEDFFVPEYENLGLEAVSIVNVYPKGSGAPSANSVYGYAPRYYAYKTKLDKVFGQFIGNGIFRQWSSQRSDVPAAIANMGSQFSLPLSLLYVNPVIFNSNFTVGLSNSPQFLCDVYFDVDAVRPMSVIGLPFS